MEVNSLKLPACIAESLSTQNLMRISYRRGKQYKSTESFSVNESSFFENGVITGLNEQLLINTTLYYSNSLNEYDEKTCQLVIETLRSVDGEEKYISIAEADVKLHSFLNQSLSSELDFEGCSQVLPLRSTENGGSIEVFVTLRNANNTSRRSSKSSISSSFTSYYNIFSSKPSSVAGDELEKYPQSFDEDSLSLSSSFASISELDGPGTSQVTPFSRSAWEMQRALHQSRDESNQLSNQMSSLRDQIDALTNQLHLEQKNNVELSDKLQSATVSEAVMENTLQSMTERAIEAENRVKRLLVSTAVRVRRISSELEVKCQNEEEADSQLQQMKRERDIAYSKVVEIERIIYKFAPDKKTSSSAVIPVHMQDLYHLCNDLKSVTNSTKEIGMECQRQKEMCLAIENCQLRECLAHIVTEYSMLLDVVVSDPCKTAETCALRETLTEPELELDCSNNTLSESYESVNEDHHTVTARPENNMTRRESNKKGVDHPQHCVDEKIEDRLEDKHGSAELSHGDETETETDEENDRVDLHLHERKLQDESDKSEPVASSLIGHQVYPTPTDQKVSTSLTNPDFETDEVLMYQTNDTHPYKGGILATNKLLVSRIESLMDILNDDIDLL
eukprot:CAMPEP_0182421502 /NCGR_PEP_ID=MMETSP1167-20130531/6933_1 /TAXON_ID=2988 /ORGANISM="Mallomonas Sp, Strain CCMP3275" /LENGTH=620 /DNA_ID=CAMNT_0024598731 /DNA_START=113 /DNA_END=1975 /DNA_ORIENTATION=-